MKTASMFSAVLACVVAAVLLAGGCGPPGGGILVTPVSADRSLKETVSQSDGWFVRNKIAIIEIDGLLTNAEMGPMFGQKENPVSLFCEKLDKAAGDPNVRAVMIRINSPGGTIAASDIMHRQLTAFRKARPDVKIAASIQDLGASGGYYVACAAGRIYALPSSLTGSIGVIFQTFSMERGLNMIGIQTLAIVSGKFKDMGTPLRDRRPEEVQLFQNIIDEYYGTFLKVVLAGRPNLTRETLTPLADGRVFTGTGAKAAGLVDDLLYPGEVLARLKSEAGLKRAKVVMYQRPGGYKGSIYAGSAVPSPAAGQTVNLINVNAADVLGPHQPRFLYLWTGQ